MRRLRFPTATLVALLAIGCSDAAGPLDAASLSRQITFGEFEQTVIAGAVRVEVELLPSSTSGGVAVAAEVEIDQREAGEEEEIESRALRFENLVVSDTECKGLVILAPNFAVSFDAATTEFEAEGDDDLTCRAFVARVEAALAAGENPEVEAERAPPAAPQAPDDPAFAAAELELEGVRSEPEVELDVDADNLQPCSTVADAPAGCLAILKVLNVPIVLQAGVTEFEAELPAARADFEDEDVEREGTVKAGSVVVNADGTGSFVLVSSTREILVSVGPGTEIDQDSGSDDERLESMAAVGDALEEGAVVETRARGVILEGLPPMLLADEVRFRVRN
jgi:hypothetical protein